MISIAKRLVLCPWFLGTLAMSGSAQTWTETAYAVTSPPQDHDEARTSFNANANQRYQWWVQEACHFRVSGSSTQSPSWRLLFDALCNNSWWYFESFDFTPTSHGTVTNRVKFTTRTGINSFSGTNPTTTASRDLDEKVVEDLYFVFDPHQEDPPGGGGN